MQKWFYFYRPTKLSFHDLTIGNIYLKALQLLLELGVNFCLTYLCPTLNIDKSMERFERDLHIRSIFAGSEDLMPLVSPKIYMRSKWKPCDWNISIALKRCLSTFHKALEPKARFRPIHHNLLPYQLRTIGFINKKPHLMVVQTYKGLGPGEIEPSEYSRFAIKYHLGNAQTYQHLSPEAASYCDTSVQKLLENWIKTYLDVLSKEEKNSFART